MSEESSWAGHYDAFSDRAERDLIFSVLDSFRQYRRAAHFNSTHVRRQSLYALPTSQWTFLSKPPFSILDTLIRVDEAIDANAELAEAIYSAALVSFGLETPSSENKDAEWIGSASKTDLDKARSTIHQLFRDWGSEGAAERDACFNPIFTDLEEQFGHVSGQQEPPAVLVPGAGLGRLVFELCRLGFNVEGNEISYHQLLGSSFILNSTTQAREWPLYPFATSFSNHLTRADQLRKVMIPDVHPGGAPTPGSMSMSAGDFCVVYRSKDYKDTFDAVVTLFFVDTAPNLIRYVEAISNCLKPGGVWINIGPLLWHFDGNSRNQGSKHDIAVDQDTSEDQGIGELGSFELSHDEVIALVEQFSFTITKNETNSINTGYIQNEKSMLQNTYRPAHWVAKKSAAPQNPLESIVR